MCGSLNHNLATTFDLGFSVRSGRWMHWRSSLVGNFVVCWKCGIMHLSLSYFDLPINSFHLPAHFPKDIYFGPQIIPAKEREAMHFFQGTFKMPLTTDLFSYQSI